MSVFYFEIAVFLFAVLQYGVAGFLAILLLASVFGILLFTLSCNLIVLTSINHRLFDDIKLLPYNDAALVLGTNEFIDERRPNPYFFNRIDAAFELYAQKKVKYLILSGYDKRRDHSESEQMKQALLRKGIPESDIRIDLSSYRTLDSIIRSKKIFNQDKITIVSQKFHNFRALYLAKQFDIDAVAYNAKNSSAYRRNKIIVREYLARCKAVIDILLVRKK